MTSLKTLDDFERVIVYDEFGAVQEMAIKEDELRAMAISHYKHHEEILDRSGMKQAYILERAEQKAIMWKLKEIFNLA